MKSLTPTNKVPRPAKVRRSQEQRRQDTQERVLKAALDLLAEEGYARLTTTAVAARAGVSRGAQENYFRTKTDLIAAATRYAMDSATAHAAKSAQAARSAPDPLQLFLDDSRAFFLSRSYRAMMELALAGRSEPALARIHRAAFVKFRKDLDRVWIRTLVDAGLPRPLVEEFVELSVYLLRGMALTELILPQRMAPAAVMRKWHTLAAPLRAQVQRIRKK
ncbi:MAG: TetR/AcrR family transcriptional regulator [Xanthobacteraceae bacterium]|nr:TetR/AcrR family transcriptional regulator [Xanthobacteraceae bacterium]MBV9629136.1 TetR/AcrR family transcriptional regulator [Xanthobacteraceae bacterium]